MNLYNIYVHTYTHILTYLYRSPSHIIFVTLRHEKSFDSTIPHMTLVFSYQ